MTVHTVLLLKGGGHAYFDAEFFVPMDSLGDAKSKTTLLNY